MAAKLTVLTILTAAMALTLLFLRHEQTRLARQVAQLDQQTRTAQVDVWQAQTVVSKMTTPEDLRDRLRAAQLALVPAVPAPTDAERAALASSSDDLDTSLAP